MEEGKGHDRFKTLRVAFVQHLSQSRTFARRETPVEIFPDLIKPQGTARRCKVMPRVSIRWLNVGTSLLIRCSKKANTGQLWQPISRRREEDIAVVYKPRYTMVAVYFLHSLHLIYLLCEATMIKHVSFPSVLRFSYMFVHSGYHNGDK
jgi:hypothetical protein